MDTASRFAELLLVGIGVTKSVLADAIGAETGNGILVNRQMRTTIEDVYAIGDVALVTMPYYALSRCIMPMIHAADIAVAVAAIHEFWFWSEQYDVRTTISRHCPRLTKMICVTPCVRESASGMSV